MDERENSIDEGRGGGGGGGGSRSLKSPRILSCGSDTSTCGVWVEGNM